MCAAVVLEVSYLLLLLLPLLAFIGTRLNPISDVHLAFGHYLCESAEFRS